MLGCADNPRMTLDRAGPRHKSAVAIWSARDRTASVEPVATRVDRLLLLGR